MQSKSAKQLLSQTPEQQALVEQELRKFKDLYQLLPTSSIRIPDWRWQMAQVITEYPFLKRYQRQDQGVQMALKLFKHLQYLDSIGRKRSRRKPLPEGVLEAYSLYCRPPRLQAELKARVLAQEPLPTIAQKINSTAEALHWYEHLFFNIADRLQAVSYIEQQVITFTRLNRNHPQFLTAFWMELGYKGGPEILDLLVPLQDRILDPLTPSDFKPTQDPQESLLRQAKLLIAARSSLVGPIVHEPLHDVRGITELELREKQAEQLKIQIQDIQALQRPLISIGLIQEDFILEDCPWKEAFIPSVDHEVESNIVHKNAV